MRSRRARSSVVEHGAHNPRVAGSIPAGPTQATRSDFMSDVSRPRPRHLVLRWRRVNIRLNSKETFIDALSTRTGRNRAASITPSSVEESRALALRIAEIISDTPAAETRVLDIHEISPVADHFVICSGQNERQLRAISREVSDQLAGRGTRPLRTEGNPADGWIVLDYGAVLVHIFDQDQREFYRLEELWSEAPTLLAIQ